ncbi:hypothetical protein Ndes2437A_g02625 [Nannochloris sp. 'desiccata']
MDAPQSGQEHPVPDAPAIVTTLHDAVVTDAAPEPPQTVAEGDEAGPGPSSAALPPAGEEEDPLVVAQREQEEREKALEEALNIQSYDDVDMRAFYSDMKEVDRENEVNRILGAFKLNPYEMLGLKFTSLDFLLGVAKEEVQKEWKKAAKHDAAARLAAVLDETGKSGVEAGWEQTAEFHEAWKIKARDVLAKAEWRRRKMTKRVQEEEERAKQEHKQEKEESKKKREADKDWESGRDERIGSWRNFVSGSGKKSKKSKKSGGGGVGSVSGGLKPPKAKTNDEDKRYVQRPVGEQFRPPPPSAPRY